MKIIDGIKTLHGRGVEIPGASRFDLPSFFVEMGYKVGAEIGVEMGRYTKYLLMAGLKVYAIDPWMPYEDFSSPNMLYPARFNKTYKIALDNLNRFPNCTIIKKLSMDAAKDFKDNSLDFVFIDGHHGFKYVAEDLWEWSKKVRPGGAISGHDYVLMKKPIRDPFAIHVAYVVNAFTDCFGIRDWYLLGAIKESKRDKWRSYLWINPKV